jgi:hypothetical protein
MLMIEDARQRGKPRGEAYDLNRPRRRMTHIADQHSEDAADRAAIDAVLADLRWQRRTPSGADVLAVGDARMGRVVATPTATPRNLSDREATVRPGR